MSNSDLAMSRLVAAVEALEQAQRQVYQARYVQNEEADDTCRRLGITHDRYEQLLKDARTVLRRGMMAGAAAPTGN